MVLWLEPLTICVKINLQGRRDVTEDLDENATMVKFYKKFQAKARFSKKVYLKKKLHKKFIAKAINYVRLQKDLEGQKFEFYN